MTHRAQHIAATSSASFKSLTPIKVGTISGAKSYGKSPRDLHRFRAGFADRWSELMRKHFDSNPLLIQIKFGVSERQARDWLAGKNAPSGPFAVIACSEIPGAMDYLRGAGQ